MNRSRKSVLALLPLLTVWACSEPTSPGEPPGGDEWQAIALDERIVHAYTGFGLDLFDELVAAAPNENLFVSPTGAAFALAMTYNGAAGETQRAMARVLGVEGMTLDEVNQANAAWFDALRSTGSTVELAIANSLWPEEDFPFREDFLDRNRTFYDAHVQALDFSDPASPDVINDWVSENTRGKIDEIIQAIDPNTVLFLINALYFKGVWTYRFDESETLDRPFTRPDGTEVTVPLMHLEADLPYMAGDGFDMVSLPYGSGRFSMILVLPNPGSNLAGFYEQLTPESWETWIAALDTTGVAVELPRFRLEWASSLTDVLTDLGMGIAFDAGAADFSGMAPGGLFISDVRQKTYLEVNEEGTEAAAVTMVVVALSSEGGPPLLRFDRPFFFAIRDNATGTLLFVGQVTDPS